MRPKRRFNIIASLYDVIEMNTCGNIKAINSLANAKKETIEAMRRESGDEAAAKFEESINIAKRKIELHRKQSVVERFRWRNWI